MKLRKTGVSSCLSFFLSASIAARYIVTAPNCTTTIVSLERCALNAEFQNFILSGSISYSDLIKCLYVTDNFNKQMILTVGVSACLLIATA
jgi:predicted naringenin-chalcone synthase